MKNFFVLLLGMIWVCSSFAQTKQYKGKVVDATTSTSLAGATIQVNTEAVTLTNEKGEFSYSCANEKVKISISFLGYETQSTDFDCKENLVIEMIPTSNNLNVIEITNTSNSSKSMLEQPLSIVKLGRPEIDRGLGLYMADAINTNVPGVLMEKRTQSGGQQINIRGYGNGMGFKGVSNNFDGQGLKMYLNGILISDAEGVTVMDDIDFGNVSNVEISKGPSGSLYGLAIAGVVNLQMQRAEANKVSVSQNVLGGSYGLFRSTTGLAIGGERSSILVNYGHQIFDGYMEHTKSSKDFVNFVGDFDLNEDQKISTYFGYSDSYDQRNGELTEGQYDTLDYSGNARYIANDAHSAVKTFRAGLVHTYKIAKQVSNTTSIFGSSQSMDNSSAGGWTDKTPLNYGFRSVFDMKFKLGEKMNLTSVTGLEMQKMNAQSVGYGMGADSTNLGGYNIITSLRSDQILNNSTYSYFTQWTLDLPKGFSVNAGVGVSNMRLSLTDRLWGFSNNTPGNEKQKSYSATYNNLVSPSFAVNKTISKVASVYASFSTAYKAPVSSNILISTTGQLNTELKPEKGVQVELGTKGQMFNNRLFYTLAAFNTRFSNKFTTHTVQNASNTATLYSYITNGGELNNNGLEVLVRFNVVKSEKGFVKLVQPFVNFTYSDFKYKNFKYEKIGDDVNGNDSTIVEDYSGNAVAGVSPIVFNAGVDFDTKIGLYANATFNYRSSMVYTSDGLNEASPYSLLNAKIGYKKTIKNFGLNAYVGANNITSTQYYNMIFVNQLPDAYIPGPNKINFFGGLSLKYNLK